MPSYVAGHTEGCAKFQSAVRRSQRHTASSPRNSRLAESGHFDCFTSCCPEARRFNFSTRGVAKTLLSCAVVLSIASNSLRVNAQSLPPEPPPDTTTPAELTPADPMPAAPTPIAPVAFKFSLEHSALPANLLDRSANAIHIEPPSRDERRAEKIRRPLETSSMRRFALLSAGVYAFALLDIHETASMPHAIELDPLARPFTGLPKPAYYASGVALATSVNFSAWMMARSPRWHHVWWVPQLGSMAGNLWGFASTKARE
jgi:hypothetical protein